MKMFLHVYVAVLILCTCRINAQTSGNTTDCGSNSIFAASGFDCATCSNQTATCPLTAEEKCYCIPGFVRDNQNNCTLPINCNTCVANEVSAVVGFDCGTCANVLTICQFVPRQGCYCRVGYVRISDSNRQCVRIQDCPTAAQG